MSPSNPTPSSTSTPASTSSTLPSDSSSTASNSAMSRNAHTSPKRTQQGTLARPRISTASLSINDNIEYSGISTPTPTPTSAFYLQNINEAQFERMPTPLVAPSSPQFTKDAALHIKSAALDHSDLVTASSDSTIRYTKEFMLQMKEKCNSVDFEIYKKLKEFGLWSEPSSDNYNRDDDENLTSDDLWDIPTSRTDQMSLSAWAAVGEATNEYDLADEREKMNQLLVSEEKEIEWDLSDPMAILQGLTSGEDSGEVAESLESIMSRMNEGLLHRRDETRSRLHDSAPPPMDTSNLPAFFQTTPPPTTGTSSETHSVNTSPSQGFDVSQLEQQILSSTGGSKASSSETATPSTSGSAQSDNVNAFFAAVPQAYQYHQQQPTTSKPSTTDLLSYLGIPQNQPQQQQQQQFADRSRFASSGITTSRMGSSSGESGDLLQQQPTGSHQYHASHHGGTPSYTNSSPTAMDTSYAQQQHMHPQYYQMQHQTYPSQHTPQHYQQSRFMQQQQQGYYPQQHHPSMQEQYAQHQPHTPQQLQQQQQPSSASSSSRPSRRFIPPQMLKQHGTTLNELQKQRKDENSPAQQYFFSNPQAMLASNHTPENALDLAEIERMYRQ